MNQQDFPGTYIAPNAIISGDVTLEKDVSVWYGAVIRGDGGPIVIGEGTNIQDLCVIHDQTTIGRRCTVGHRAIVHGCTVGDNCVIGMGAVVLDGAVLEDHCFVGAGALVTGKTHAPAGSMLLGSPARIVREVSPEMREKMQRDVQSYIDIARRSLPAR